MPLGGEAGRAWLGVSLGSARPGQGGVTLSAVRPHSPAATAGLLAGDVAVGLNGGRLERPTDLLALLRRCQPGERVSLLVQRGTLWLPVSIALQAEPGAEERARWALVGREAAGLDGLVKAGGGRPLPDAFLQPAGLRGQAVLLDFGASHCPPCRLLGPELERWNDRFAARGLSVVAIAEESVEQALRWALAARIPYAVAADPEGVVAGRYWISDLPTVVLVGKTGVVEDVVVGFAPESFPRLIDAIERALAAEPLVPRPRIAPSTGP